ncbi:uncharacterized protein [Nicotiana tomentosiformis]|uniref:uncharacterized protein n=1 Tax=Nicotiana tomentosiformis TaxID=4098 RepID=UPI00388CB887
MCVRVGKDAVLSPSSVEEEASASDPKPMKDNKRKRSSSSKDPKLKTRMARKPRNNTIPLSVESVLRLRDEEEEKKRRAAVVHREACSRSRAELRRYEADLQWVMEERNTLKLLLGKMGEEIKDLRAELAKTHQDQTDLSEQVMILLKAYGLDIGTKANFSVSQLQQKLEMIRKLCEEVDVIKAESLKWKESMDRFAAEKEAARAQLSSAENQLQSMKGKSSVQARRIEELDARLASELAKAKSDAEKAKVDADAFVAVYRADAEAFQCQSRRETLKEIHARGFDLSEEIKRAKDLKADVEPLASDDGDGDTDDDGDDGSKSGSESGEEPDVGETALVDNQET